MTTINDPSDGSEPNKPPPNSPPQIKEEEEQQQQDDAGEQLEQELEKEIQEPKPKLETTPTPYTPKLANITADQDDDDDDDRKFTIKKLKAKLINEEHRLVLMKKIRQSQTRPVGAQNNTSTNNAHNNSTNNINNHNQNHHSQSNSLNNYLPSNLHQANHHSLKKLRTLQNTGPMALQKNSHSLSATNLASGTSSVLASGLGSASSSSLNQTPAHAHQRPKANNLWNPPPQQARHPAPIGIASPHVGNLSRPPITTPPNVVQDLMGKLTSSQSLLLSQINAAVNRRPQQNQQPQQQQSSSFNKASTQAAQLLMQKQRSSQNFNKQLSQKQLDQQMLLQHQASKQFNLTPSVGGFNVGKRSSGGMASPHVGNLSRQPITTPPNVVQDLRGNLSGQQSLLMNAASSLNAGRRSQQSTPQQTFNKSQTAQMLLQKRTAAKQAIQKQLEQTLTQLPQKQVQLGIDFLPNANNYDFVQLIGLELCVDYLTGTKNSLETQPLEKPFECSTCGTDFTPNWSWKRANAVCENCVANHVKKSIKNSQANRIKSLLAKAVKQEQDIDQRIMSEATNVVSTPSPTPSNSQQHSLLQPVTSHQQPQRSSSQAWSSRANASPLTSSGNASTRTTPSSARPQNNINQNPLATLAANPALASLVTPQLSTILSLMQASNNANANNNTNQIVSQATALLMNQIAMNMYKRQ